MCLIARKAIGLSLKRTIWSDDSGRSAICRRACAKRGSPRTVGYAMIRYFGEAAAASCVAVFEFASFDF